MSETLEDYNKLISHHLAVSILEQIPTMVMAVDRDQKIIFMNAAGRHLLGKPWEEIAGQTCYSLINSQHCETSDCRMQQAAWWGMIVPISAPHAGVCSCRTAGKSILTSL